MSMKSVVFLLTVILGGSAQAAVTETQPQVQVTPPLQAAPQTTKPPRLTPEQEATLVEVRKILREAREVAEGFALPNKLTTTPVVLSGLERRKAQLLDEIEKAQIRAGDLSNVAMTKHVWLLTRAQVRYGQIKDAIQTAARHRVDGDELLALLEDFLKTGDIPSAVAMLYQNLDKLSVPHLRQRNQAIGLSLIARWQYEAGDPTTSETMQRAIRALPGTKYTEDRYRALLHVARTQAILGDRKGSEESFRQAIEIALAQRELSEKVEALRVIAKAQAESGNGAASGQTFQQAIQIINAAPPPRIFNLGCIAWSQVASGNKAAGIQTFQQAIRNADEVQIAKRGQVLRELGAWQVKAGDAPGARKTFQLMLQWAESLADAEAKSTAIASAAGLAVLVGDPKQAIELAEQVSDDWERAGVLASIALTLIKTQDPFGTHEMFQQLAGHASAILKNPPPKEQSKSDNMRSSIAFVQTADGDVSTALRTADMIGFLSARIRAYGKAANLLTARGHFAGAKEVIRAMKEDWLAFSEGEDAVRKLAQAQALAGDETAAIAWARQQKSLYAKAHALLGVALGLMERHGIEDFERFAQGTPMRDQCPILVDSSP